MEPTQPSEEPFAIITPHGGSNTSKIVLTTTTKDIIIDKAFQALRPGALEPCPAPDISKAIPPTTHPDGDNHRQTPPCITQNSFPQNVAASKYASIMADAQDSIKRWKPGSVITWTAWRMGYDTQEDADHAAQQLALAANEWNKAQVGITFEWVPFAREANFVLCHGGINDSVIARSFFPNHNDLNFVFVFSLGFAARYRERLWRPFMHELGHVIGLRHESAAEDGEAGIVQFGEMNEESVMGTGGRRLPVMQPSDVEWTRKFYELPEGYKIGESLIEDFIPK